MWLWVRENVPLLSLANAITSGNEAAAMSIAGVACQRQGKNILNQPKFIENMDEIPYPARHLLAIRAVRSNNRVSQS